MDAKKNNLMDSINTVFKLAIKVQEDYIKYSPFPELSMNEMHIIEAVSKQQFPTMTNVAKTLKVTVGTLTTNVKTIVNKGFLTRERSSADHRVTYLHITDKGYQALEVHNQFHRDLSGLYSQHIPDEMIGWVYDTIENVIEDLKEYQKKLNK